MPSPSRTPKKNHVSQRTQNASTTPHLLTSKSLRLVKKSRKNSRKLRKLALKQEDRVLVAYAENMVEIFDAIIANHKIAKAEAKDREKLGVAKK